MRNAIDLQNSPQNPEQHMVSHAGCEVPQHRSRSHSRVPLAMLPRDLRRFRGLRSFSGGLLCLAAAACGSDTTGPPPQDPATTYWLLRLNHHAITMTLTAPTNRVQLTAVPLTVAATPVLGAESVQYSTSDTTVAVDSLGLVTALHNSFGQVAHVVASLTVNGVTLKDTAYVQVDPFPLAHPVASFSIHPQGTTCHRSAYDTPFYLPVYIVDATGDTVRNASVAGVPVYYASSDVTISNIDRSYGYVQSSGPAQVTFTATALIDGVAYQDTLSYVFGPSHTVLVTTDLQPGTVGASATLAFTPSAVTVGAGWLVDFVNPTVNTVDVVFTDPTHGVSGDFVGRYTLDNNGMPVGSLIPGTFAETFFDPGTYAYHSDRFGSSGTITVQCSL